MPDPQQLLQTLQDFITAKSWNDSQRIVETHPELLTDAADDLLTQLVAQYTAQGDERASRILTDHRDLLRRCRESGTAAAFAEKTGGQSTRPTPTNLPTELQSIIDELSQPIRSLQDMPRRIDLCRRALALVGRDDNPELWAALHGTLANNLGDNPHGSRADNIEQAIQHYILALKVYTRQTFPIKWATTQNNLGEAYRKRIKGSRTENIEQSIKHYQLALEVRTRQAFPQDWAGTQNNLGLAYSNRIEGSRTDNLEQAIIHFRLALDVYTRQTFPDKCRQTARSLGNLAFDTGNWALVVEGYDTALAAQDILLQAALRRTGKQAELAEMQTVPARAAYAHARLGNAAQAVETLEGGRAYLLREGLARTRRDLAQLPALGFAAEYEAYQNAIRRFDELQAQTSDANRPADWLAQMEGAQQAVQAAAQAIRDTAGKEHPQFAYFMASFPFAEIQAQAQRAPLVYLLATAAGGLALIVHPAGVETVWLDDLTEKALNELLLETDEKEETVTGGYLPAQLGAGLRGRRAHCAAVGGR